MARYMSLPTAPPCLFELWGWRREGQDSHGPQEGLGRGVWVWILQGVELRPLRVEAGPEGGWAR